MIKLACMDLEMGTFEAKNKLSQLLVEVERGQRVYITRRGKRVALLVSAAEDSVDGPASAEDHLARIRKLRAEAKAGPESFKELIEEGR